MTRDAGRLPAVYLVFLTLAACGTTGPSDGPPQRGTAVPRSLPGDAVPRDEPRSRYGNGPTYTVRGVNYRVLPSSHGYQERGVASWYGKKFHGRMTSSQEPYDMYAMTAAHKSLPLPTYVRVRNLKNNRSVVVRVNDRGPFVDNRLIDLSYSAALRLDMVRDGTTLVEVTAMSYDQAPPPRATTASRQASASDSARLFVQVGAFGDRNNARRRYRMLRSNGIDKVFLNKDKGRNPALYRVRIGPIATVEQYDALVARLRNIGIAESHLVSD